ncbi:MAG: leucyl aminopeptidase [Micrococcales bacterium]|nr:leucyl aminopeptidase [Micrococcales bacterium]
MPNLALSTMTPQDADADSLAVFVGQGDGDDPSPRLLDGGRLPPAAVAGLRDAMRTLRVTGKADETARITGTPGLRVPLVVLTGVGAAPNPAAGGTVGEDDLDATAFPPETLRRAAGAASRACAGRPHLAVLMPDLSPRALRAIAEGAALGAYRFVEHRGAKAVQAMAKDAPVAQVDLLVTAQESGTKPAEEANSQAAQAVQAAQIAAAEQAWARDLVNSAPNSLYPQSFADAVSKHAPPGVAVDVMDEVALVEGGFGGIVGVGQGSAHSPRLVTMAYAPKGAQVHLAFVGKGITFDSGGLCIKPGKSMITMKCDMGGAAAVAAAVAAIAQLKLPVAVTGYLCLAENMPGSNAQRPGDVVTMRDGQTVEIINTDAEGRLVMADGIALAAEKDPDAIIDVATLTGAAMVALGSRTAAVMANDDELQGDLTSAATSVGESVWPMPITEEIRAGMDSLVADISHMGGDTGGAMTAAAFLRNFVGTRADGQDTSWGHLDIAGPAYNERVPHGYTPKGGTGFATRTLVAFAQARAQEQ